MGIDVQKFAEVKVGQIRAAIDGVDDNVRVGDVVAVRSLMSEHIPEWKLDAAVKLYDLADHMLALSMSFSQDKDKRDLDMAQRLVESQEGWRRVAQIFMDSHEPEAPKTINGSTEMLCNECISKAASAGVFVLARVLEALLEGLGGNRDRYNAAKAALKGLNERGRRSEPAQRWG